MKINQIYYFSFSYPLFAYSDEIAQLWVAVCAYQFNDILCSPTYNCGSKNTVK